MGINLVIYMVNLSQGGQMKDGDEDSECRVFEVRNMPSQEYWITSFKAADLENKNVSLKEVCFDGLD